MSFINLKNKRLFLTLSFFIFSLTFLLKLPGAILPPTDYFYTLIERTEIFSIFGLFAGLIPAGVTFWSLGIYAIPLILVYTLDFILIHPQALLSVLKHNPGILVQELTIYIASAFLNPTRQLIIGRIFVALISSLAPLALLGFFRKRNQLAAGIFSVTIFLTSPFLVNQSYSLLPDPLGLTFFTFALVILLGQEQLSPKRIFIGSIFLGLAIAAKFIYVAFLPAAFLAVLFGKINSPPGAAKRWNPVIFIAGLLLAILIFIPFIWTAPLALSRNLSGTLRQYYCQRASSWRFLLLETIPHFINWLGLPFFIIGFIFSFFVLKKRTAILLAVGFLSFLFPLGNADFFSEKYALPLIPFLCLYAGMGLDLIIRTKKYNFKILLIALFTGAIFVSNLACVIKDFKITHNNTNSLDCVNWIKKNIDPSSNIAIPEQLDYFFVPSDATLERWLNNLNNSYDSIDTRLNSLFLIARTEFHNLNRENPLVPKIFGALEQQRIFVYKILLWYFRNVEKPKISYNLFLYLPAKDYKLGIISAKKEDVLNLFLENKVDVFVSDEYLATIPLSPVKYFNRYPGGSYYIYLNNGK